MMQVYEVARPWPHPMPAEGLQMLADPGDEGLSVTLVAAVPSPTRGEVRALTKGRMRLGILPRPPVAYVVLLADGIALDAPYCLGIHNAQDIAQRRASAGLARSWTERQKGLLTVATVDSTTRITRGLRAVTLSRSWWIALADALDQCGPTDGSARDRSMRETYARYPMVADMARDCAIIEVAGIETAGF